MPLPSIGFLFVVLATLSALTRAGELSMRDSVQGLVDLEGLVVATEVADEVLARGVSRYALARHVEERLVAAGIRVLNREQPVRQGAAVLLMRASSAADPLLGTIVLVTAVVREPVRPVRDPSRSVVASIWMSGHASDVAPGGTQETVLAAIDRQLDDLVRDWRAAHSGTN